MGQRQGQGHLADTAQTVAGTAAVRGHPGERPAVQTEWPLGDTVHTVAGTAAVRGCPGERPTVQVQCPLRQIGGTRRQTVHIVMGDSNRHKAGMVMAVSIVADRQPAPVQAAPDRQVAAVHTVADSPAAVRTAADTLLAAVRPVAESSPAEVLVALAPSIIRPAGDS
jgi:hypothetical protein